jgi:hypothetical protein
MLMVRIAIEAYLFNSRREIAGIHHPDKDSNDLLCISKGIMGDDEIAIWKVVFCEASEVWSSVAIGSWDLHNAPTCFHGAALLFPKNGIRDLIPFIFAV